MRVLLDYRPALRQRSGVGEYTHQLAMALLAGPTGAADDGVHLTLFSSSLKDRLRPNADLAGASMVDRRVPVQVLNLAWHRLGWPPVEWLASGAYDVAHSMHPLLMPARRAAQVVTIYDLNFLKHPERTRAEIRRDYPALVRRHAHRADAVIVISQFTADEVTRLLDLPPERMQICAPGRPSWPARAARPRSGHVLFLGTLEPRKNVGTLLDAYEQLIARRADLPPLVLAGATTGQSGPWIERISRAPLNRLVRHVGYVEDEQRRSLYADALMLVQPSFEEGFGMPVLEAMTVGVPVIGADAGAIPEVANGSALLVPPGDAEALAGAIERLLDDTTLQEACASRGLERARAYSWHDTAAGARRAYDEARARQADRRAH